MTSILNKTSGTNPSASPHVRLLFQDPMVENARYFKKHGFSHINHTVVVQNAILRKHPWVALSLFKVFAEATQRCYARIDHLQRSSVMAASAVLEAQRRTFGDDPFSYRFQANREAVQTLADHAFEQGLLRQRVDTEAIFAESTRDV